MRIVQGFKFDEGDGIIESHSDGDKGKDDSVDEKRHGHGGYQERRCGPSQINMVAE